jgi:hypothetical protein
MSLDTLYTMLFESGNLKKRVTAALIEVSDGYLKNPNTAAKKKRAARAVLENPQGVAEKVFRSVALHPTIKSKGDSSLDGEITDVVTELFTTILED